MRRITPIVAAFALLLALAGCAGEKYTTREIAVTAFELEGVNGGEITFQVTGRWSNTCGEVSAFNSSKEGNVFSVSMIGRQPEGVTCGQAMTDITGEWIAKVREPGSYEFRFMGRDGAYLEKTVEVR